MKIPKRIAQALMNSLKGGVVPRVGLNYVTVGRTAEIDALLRDVEMIAEGGASFRFIVGKYGSGKSFLLQTIRNYVMAKNFVVVDADLSPERRLQGTRGQGLATYKELIRNMSTKTRPEGGALSLILDRWISSVQQQVLSESDLSPTDPALQKLVEKRISAVICSLNEMVHGFDFARLLTLTTRPTAMTMMKPRQKCSNGSGANTTPRRKPGQSWGWASSSPMMTGTNTSSSLPLFSSRRAMPVCWC